MKKSILTALLIGLSAIAWAGEAVEQTSSSWTDNIQADLSVAYMSDYIYRGTPYANDVAEFIINANTQLAGGTLYTAWENRTATHGREDNQTSNYGVEENNFIAGYQYSLFDNYTVDAGAIYHWYSEDSRVDMRREIYVGVNYAGLVVDPSLYIYYDFDLDGMTTELSGSYDYSLASLGLEKATVTLGSLFGYVTYDDLNSNQRNGKSEEGYAYAELSADLTYEVSEDITVKGTLGYASGNNQNRDGYDKCGYAAIKLGYKL